MISNKNAYDRLSTSFLYGLLILPIVLFSINSSKAQSSATDSLINSKDGTEIEEFLEDSEEEEFTDDTYFENLVILANNRININFATREDLEALDLLSDLQIQNILFYREKFGELKSPYELLGIETLTTEEIKRLLPYIKFSDTKDPPKPLKEQFKEGKHTIFLRYIQILEEKKGFTPPDTNSDGSLTTRYLGIEPRLYARYRFQYGTDLSIGITAEQDAGEPFKHPNQKIGLDYLSGHFYLKDRGFLKKLVVGDYEVNLGQGLFLQQSYSGRKSSYVNDIKKKRIPFKPHTSAGEVVFSRGLAAEVELTDHWSIVGFGSFRQLDANVVFFEEEDIDTDIPLNVSSLQTSGYHRTESELADKGSIDMWSGGGSVAYNSRKIRLAANAAYFKTSLPLVKSDQPYNKFEFSGNKLFNTSLDYQYLNKNMSLFGELAFSDNGGWGMLNGANFNLPLDIKLTLAHRYYDKDFHTLYGNAFSESTRPINEHGLYVGLYFSPFKYAEWSNYVDIYQHKWLRFGIDGPSHGVDILSKFEYQPKYWLKFYIRGRYERKQENAPDNATAIDYLVSTTKSGLRFHFEYKATSKLTLKSRVEFAWYNDGVNPLSKGIMAYQDVNYRCKKIPLSFSARYALFQTDSYDSRIYAYENDLLYVFSIPAFSGRGSRYYLTAKVDLHRYIDFWVKWSQVIYPNATSISDGTEEIENNVRSEIKLQVRFKF
ncbi:MAG: helix-hairpin-helix domain-containing protein [Bacteroidetes bacterium]|nr:helix-hairpin-helix domain-containing protein [Bacteroidota bacterium]